MTTRERWIVYPLLFLSLGVALRDKIIPPVLGGNPRLRFEALEIAAGEISCSELRIFGPDGQPVVLAGVEANTHSGLLETRTSSGVPLVQLRSNEDGGYVTAIGRGGRIGLMGHTPQDFGLFEKMPQTGWAVPIFVWPGNFKIEKKGGPTPKTQALPRRRRKNRRGKQEKPLQRRASKTNTSTPA